MSDQAERERLRDICRSARYGISDVLESTDQSAITIMLSGLVDDLKEAD